MLGFVVVIVAGGIMYMTMKSRNSLPRETRTKLLAFSIVAGLVGLLLVYKSYHWVGTFWGTQAVMNVDEIAGLSELGENPSKNDLRDSSLRKSDDIPLVDMNKGTQNEFYGIMFDAGSTGSRVHAMKFASAGPGSPLKFVDVRFVQVKPGLSSFATDPQKGADSLIPLLDAAKEFIPKHLHSSTPIALKATAGLRMLPADQSSSLLDHVAMLFKRYPFHAYNDSVGIMGGKDEGIFCWFTLNFFLEAMQNIKSSIGVIDLGGGSAQITFVPQQRSTLMETPKDDLMEIDVLGRKHKLYTHSYLGLGLMSARLQILGGREGDGGSKLESACFTPGIEQKWTHAGKEYIVKGLEDNGHRFETCYKAAVDLIEGKIQHVREIQDDYFCTISYFYDMAVEYGLIENGNEGKNLTVEQYFTAAQTECQKPHPQDPFLCLDLSYMSALLHNGFGFSKNTRLVVIKRVKGREISWALGAMFNFFNTHHIGPQ